MPDRDFEQEARRDIDRQMGRMIEAIDNLKGGHIEFMRALGSIREEQGKQTTLLATIGQKFESQIEVQNGIKETQGSHETRIEDLEKSRARALGAASVFSVLSGSIGMWIGKHFG